MIVDRIGNKIDDIVELLLEDYSKKRDVDNMDIFSIPDKVMVVDILNKLLRLVYPGYYREHSWRSIHLERQLTVVIEDVSYNLSKQVAVALRYDPKYQDADEQVVNDEAQEIVIAFLGKLPKIREYVNTDLQATFDGDPAADSKDDIVLSYPGLHAITINRIAHELWLLKVPLIPRMMTEYAHSETGIDIHPGATIGKFFCIDHGTGIVIGSTSVIGAHVKLYQGVTIGALSTKLGHKLHGTKRHPTLEDNVTVYSNASILGGETVIGKGAVIGGSSFITESVEPGARVSFKG
ncbi:serine O-acetyltransferase [[Clostridium] aminophilum]|uniref:Serine acetyltransferase n=1 Tax=[Clostridium] aminophilum TaxID=1526 RepID=A0A1I6IEM7_9FIRM|nr:serine acetyltransferase [[Clostridium] aminophilum]MCR4628851.1 serine acetyltransferase [Clostridium sp.]SFR65225.1 serine O-acetyltransferase [[Clostridium] aminophilum]